MKARRGFSLLELLAVVSLLGIFAVVVSSRMSCDMGKNLGARADARRLVVDLLQAQRRAIATGDNHYLGLTSTGYTLYRRSGTTGVAVDSPRVLSRMVSLSTAHSEVEFKFDGGALAAYEVNVIGGTSSWRVTVTPSTGAVQMKSI